MCLLIGADSVHSVYVAAGYLLVFVGLLTPQSTEVPYLDHGEPENEPIEKVYVTTLVTPMGLFNYVDGINSKITPKK